MAFLSYISQSPTEAILLLQIPNTEWKKHSGFIVTGAEADSHNLLIRFAPLTRTNWMRAFVTLLGSCINNEDIDREPSPITDT